MKTSFYYGITIATLALEFSSFAAPSASTSTASNAVPQSSFTVPANKSEGRDPFFPNSDRLWAHTEAEPVVVAKQQSTGTDCLVLKGLSGVPSNPLAMINGRTMARGEDAEIKTDCGKLVVHCVDITTNSAIVEVAGERRELHLRSDL